MATITVPVPEGFPLFGWDEQSIKSYCDQKPVQKGDVMIIYNGQAGIHEYLLAVVENPSSGKQRQAAASNSFENSRLGWCFFLSNRQELLLP